MHGALLPGQELEGALALVLVEAAQLRQVLLHSQAATRGGCMLVLEGVDQPPAAPV